jgi:hypothetical protein
LTIRDKPDALVKNILAGSPINGFKDRTGKKMTDSHLKAELGKHVSWVPTLYDQASGYVHLSEQHMYNSLGRTNESGTSLVKIDGRDGGRWTEDARVETIHSFCSATRLVLEIVEMWGICEKRKFEGGGQLAS